MLRSKLFSNNPRLQDCAIFDASHVTAGDSGEHVRLIQDALKAIDGAIISQSEQASARYGPSTAAAVLKYKTRRKIINYNYETSADPIVGKMTIARLDRDASDLEAQDGKPVAIAFGRPWNCRY